MHAGNERQRKVGLLVTDELATAIDECKATVDGIIKECRQKNRKFRDLEFDLEYDRRRCLLGLHHESLYRGDVRRVTQIFEKPSFYIDTFSSRDVVQGSLSNCWFLSALATVSLTNELIEKICVARDEQVGVYGFIFFRDVKWVVVIIDDLLFIRVPKFEELDDKGQMLYHEDKDRYNAIARIGGKSLYFARSSTEGETWVPLIEKAYAKLYGSYQALDGGHTGEALEDLTGGVTSTIVAKDILDKDKFWHEELCQVHNDRTFGCYFTSTHPSRKSLIVRGLIAGHTYSILRAVEYNGKKFVVLYNPWGDSEWTGPWSDGSKEWNREWLPALQTLGHSFGNDGQFVMEYDDFLENWEIVDRTLLFDSSWAMSYHWERIPVTKRLMMWTFGNVSFTITMPTASPVVIVLAKLKHRFFSRLGINLTWDIDFVVYRKGDKIPIVRSNSSLSSYLSVNVETYLNAGEYIVHVRLDHHDSSPNDRQNVYIQGDDRTRRRILAEKAKSEAIVSHFQRDVNNDALPIPLETLAGRDLSELQNGSMAYMKKLSKDSKELKTDQSETVQEKKVDESVHSSATDIGEDFPASLTEQRRDRRGDDDKKTNDKDGEKDKDGGKDKGDDEDKDGDKDKCDDEDKDGDKDQVDLLKRDSLTDALQPSRDAPDANLFLGLRVYTKTNCHAVISGQVREQPPSEDSDSESGDL